MNLEIFIFPSHLITETRYYKLRFSQVSEAQFVMNFTT